LLVLISLAILCAALTMALTGPASAAASTQIEGVTLDPPDAASGWVRTDSGGGVQLQKQFPGAPANGRNKSAALIQISKPVPSASGPFAANYAQMVRALPGLADEKPMTKTAGVTINGYPILVERRCCAVQNGVSISAILVGIEGRDIQLFLVLALLQVTNEQQKQVEAEFEALVRSVRLVPGDRPFGIVAPKDGGGLDGAFTHFTTGLMPNAFGGMDFYSRNEIRLFDQAGLYSRSIPKGGADIGTHCRSTPTDCGTYRLIGGSQIEMREVTSSYGILERRAMPFQRNGDDVKIDGADYRRVAPLSRGDRFDGVWRYSYASSGTTAFSSGGGAIERILTLTRDGRFTRTGWSGVSSTHETGNTRTGVTGSAERPIEQGRYEADRYQLKLTGEDGRTQSLSLFRPDRNSDDLLVIDGDNYLRNKPDKTR
jgi:hypothetical protein